MNYKSYNKYMKYDAIVLASGVGSRANLGYNKVLFKMKNGLTVIENAYSIFLNDEDCNKVIVAFNLEDFDRIVDSRITKVYGGQERKDSVNNCLEHVTSDYVLIHDGARPYLSKEDLDNLKNSLVNEDGCILAYKAFNTIKQVKDGYIVNTLDRNYIYEALTPQGFKTSIYKSCINKDNINYTDDASLLEMNGYKVKIVEGSKSNIKLTFKEDFENER